MEWDEQQQGWALALALHRRTRCSGCGGDLLETTEVGNEGRYRALLPLTCHRCVELDRSHQRYRDHPAPLSLLHRVELKRGDHGSHG